MGAKRLGLHRSLCGSAADRARRPPFRVWSISRNPTRRALAARSVLRSLFSVLRDASASLPFSVFRSPGRVSAPLICSKSVRYRKVFLAKRRNICGSLCWQSFVCLCGPSCSSCQPRRANLPLLSHRSARRPAGAFRSPFSVFRSPGRVSAPPVLCSPFSGAPEVPHDYLFVKKIEDAHKCDIISSVLSKRNRQEPT